MVKLTTKQIAEIIELKKSGKTQVQIATFMGVSQNAIKYWLFDKDKRKEISQKNIQRFRNLPVAKKKEIYSSRKEYMRVYMKKKYHENKTKEVEK